MYALEDLFSCERTEVSLRIERVTNSERTHSINELFDKWFVNFIGNNDSFGCNTGLASVDGARFDRGAQCALEIRAGHDDECIAAAKLQHSFLDLTRGCARDGGSGFLAACHGYRFDARVDDQFLHLWRLDHQRLENAVSKSGVAKDVFNSERALRNIRSVFEQTHVTRKQCRCGKSEDLPERKIPRHDRQYRSERLIFHVT